MGPRNWSERKMVKRFSGQCGGIDPSEIRLSLFILHPKYFSDCGQYYWTHLLCYFTQCLYMQQSATVTTCLLGEEMNHHTALTRTRLLEKSLNVQIYVFQIFDKLTLLIQHISPGCKSADTCGGELVIF